MCRRQAEDLVLAPQAPASSFTAPQASASSGVPDAPLKHLLAARPALQSREPMPAVVVGKIVALTDDGCTPLVVFDGRQDGAAVRARTTVDLHGRHIGQPVTLVFDAGDVSRPIVTGVLREAEGWPLADPPGQIEVSAHGERLVVSAREQLVLRCGKASVTLMRDGRVAIEGSYVSSRSSGVNRIKGGSVQLN